MHTKLLSAILVAVVFGCTALAGCNLNMAGQTQPHAALVEQPKPGESLDPTIGTPGESSLAFIVDGHEIPMSQLTDLLIDCYGLDAAYQLISSIIVEREATRAGITITPADITAETFQTLQAYNPNLQPDQIPVALDAILEQHKIPRPQWKLNMKRNALLRKLAVARIRVSNEMLQQEFQSLYGKQVQVRIIQCFSQQQAGRILDWLDEGQDFATLARQLSSDPVSARNGGLLAPFSRRNEQLPEVFRGVAFSLQEGQVSQVVSTQDRFYILRVEKFVAPKDVKFEDVEDTLRQQLTDAMVKATQMGILRDLLRESEPKVIYVNKALNEQFRQAKLDKAAKP